MSYDASISKVLFYSLSIAFVFVYGLVPYIKESCIRMLAAYRKKRWKSGMAEDLGNLNEIISDIRGLRLKPFTCLKCMSFWVSILFALIFGYKQEAGLVGIAGLACGMLLEGILMRYL
jgi:hypothetical protein